MSGDIHALSGAYAVDALDDAERADFERHLAQCASCRAEVDGLIEAASSLGSLAEETPPPSLRDSVLAGISTVRPLPPAISSPAAPRRRRWGTAVLAAAAAVVVLAAGVAVWQPWDHQSSTQVAPTLVDRVIAAPDAQRIDTQVNGGGAVTVYRSVSLDKAVVVTRGLPSAPSGKVYELWLQDARGTMRPAGLMSGGDDVRVALHGSAGTAEGAGLTVEPAGGSKAPTTKPIALVAFT